MTNVPVIDGPVTEIAVPAPAQGAGRRGTALLFLRDRGIVVLWVALILLMWLWAGSAFGSWDNAVLVLNAAAITAIFAAGIAFGVLGGVLDLSIPGTAAAAGVVCAKLLVSGVPS